MYFMADAMEKNLQSTGDTTKIITEKESSWIQKGTFFATSITALSIIVFSLLTSVNIGKIKGDIGEIKATLVSMSTSLISHSNAFEYERNIQIHASISKLQAVNLCHPVVKIGSPVGITPHGREVLGKEIIGEIGNIEKEYKSALPIFAVVDSVILRIGIENFLMRADEIKTATKLDINAADLRALIYICIREMRI